MKKWTELQPHLLQMLGDEDYETWVSPLQALEETKDVLVLTSANPIVLDWIRDHLINDLEAVARSHFGRQFQIRLGSVHPTSVPDQKNSTRKIPTLPLTPQFTFDRFVIGPSNQFACAAAAAVAERPGETYNPLFIYGGSGLGKTHLLHAIAHKAVEKNRDIRAVYLTTEQFTNEFIYCLQTKDLDLFRQTFRDVDILLLDDIQFRGGKEQTQQEFFHTVE